MASWMALYVRLKAVCAFASFTLIKPNQLAFGSVMEMLQTLSKETLIYSPTDKCHSGERVWFMRLIRTVITI